MQTYEVVVPYTETVTENGRTIDGEEVDRAELRKSTGKGKFVLILKGNEKLTENHKAVLKPDTLVLHIESKSP